MNYQATWMNNPQYLLVTDSSGTVQISLDQQLGAGQTAECVGIYAFRCNGQRRLDYPTQLVVTMHYSLDELILSLLGDTTNL